MRDPATRARLDLDGRSGREQLLHAVGRRRDAPLAGRALGAHAHMDRHCILTPAATALSRSFRNRNRAAQRPGAIACGPGVGFAAWRAERRGTSIIDEAALDAAAEKESFTGVVTVDVGDERRYERVRGLRAPRAARCPTPRRPGSRSPAAARRSRRSRCSDWSRRACWRSIRRSRGILGADLPLIDDEVTVEQLLTHTSGIGDYLDEEADWDAADYVLPVPVHLLGRDRGVRARRRRLPAGVRAGRAVRVLQRRLHRARADRRARQRPRVPRPGRRGGLRAGGAAARRRSCARTSSPATPRSATCSMRATARTCCTSRCAATVTAASTTTADDLHTFWRALLDGRIVSEETVEEMTRPRYDVPEEGLRYGMGVYARCDRTAAHHGGLRRGRVVPLDPRPAYGTTVSVLGNSSEGAWPVVNVAGRRRVDRVSDCLSPPTPSPVLRIGPSPSSSRQRSSHGSLRALAELRVAVRPRGRRRACTAPTTRRTSAR